MKSIENEDPATPAKSAIAGMGSSWVTGTRCRLLGLELEPVVANVFEGEAEQQLDENELLATTLNVEEHPDAASVQLVAVVDGERLLFGGVEGDAAGCAADEVASLELVLGAIEHEAVPHGTLLEDGGLPSLCRYYDA